MADPDLQVRGRGGGGGGGRESGHLDLEIREGAVSIIFFWSNFFLIRH